LARPADHVSDAAPSRPVPDLPRHLPDAGLRAPLRSGDPRRVDHRGCARRAGADPPRSRARLGRRAIAAAASRGGRAGPVIGGGGVRLRRAEPAAVKFLSELPTDPEAEPYLAAVTPRDSAELLQEIERSLREPNDGGRFVIEVEEAGEWQPAGTLRFEIRNHRSRIASLGALAVAPAFRGRRVGDTAAHLIQRHLI